MEPDRRNLENNTLFEEGRRKRAQFRVGKVMGAGKKGEDEAEFLPQKGAWKKCTFRSLMLLSLYPPVPFISVPLHGNVLMKAPEGP